MNGPAPSVRGQANRLAHRLAHRLASRLPRPQRVERSSAAVPEPPLRVPSNPPLGPEPLVSVVVPVYQVEEYLGACLDSLLDQTYRHLEIIVVDDGSTDGSAAIARRYAHVDERIVVVRQENAGLGAARNTGLDHSTGVLVAFADSDDTVPPTAYQCMVRALQRSGSDFVVGAVTRDLGGRHNVRPWVKKAHARRRLAITIDDAPTMLINNVACTKLFRREFLERVSFRFPEGVHYEDQVPITKAYLQARTFDVVPDVVYQWRVRDDQSSISQQKAEIRDLVDKLAGQRQVAEFLHESASAAVLHRWYAKTLRHDFLIYLRIAADADDRYWHTLQESIVSIAQRAPEDIDDEVEMGVRLAVWLARHGHRRALKTLVSDEGFHSSNFPTRLHDGHLYAEVDLGRSDVRLPEALLRIRAVDQQISPRLQELDWMQDGMLRVRCLAVMPYVDPSRHPVVTSFELVGPAPLPPVAVAAEVVNDPVGNLWSPRAHEDHARSTVEGQVDLGSLARASRGRRVTRWELRVAVSAFGVRSEAAMDARPRSGSAVTARAVIVDGALVTPRWSDGRGLLVEVHRHYAAVTGVRLVDDEFELDVRAPRMGPLTRVLVGGAEMPVTVTPTEDPDTVTIRVRCRLPSGAARTGRLRVGGTDTSPVPLRVVDGPGPGSVSDGQVCLGADAEGCLVAEKDRPCLLVDHVQLDETTVLLTGRAHRATGATAVLRGPRAETSTAPVDVVAGRFSVRLPLRHTPCDGRETVLPTNAYRVLVTGSGAQVRVVAGRLLRDAPSSWTTHGWTLEVGADGRLALRRSPTVDPVVMSRFHQQLLRKDVYSVALRGPRRDMAVFEAFGGAGTGDGAGAVCAALLRQGTDLDLVWSVNDWSVSPPAGTRAVLRGTREWYDAMGAARLLVTNSTLPDYFRKAPGQTYVQTWHGTPLKRIGTDVVSTRLSTERYLRFLQREARTWDVLVSSSPFATRVFRKALGYDGRILEIGRPSNDLLLSPAAPAVRAEVRARLGIGEDQTVVLYAPTWRDDARRGAGWEKVLHLDHDRVTAARPDVTVLVRGHPNTATGPVVRGSERVVDVTSYPDIARLYLAADVLVTDYSAAMVDFALTDKRIILLAPDLATYRDRVRGLYLDLEKIAPGPLVTTTDEVLALLDEDSWGVARKELRETFAPYDDGKVTDRLLSRVLP